MKIFLFIVIAVFLYLYLFTGVFGYRSTPMEKHFRNLYEAKRVTTYRTQQEGTKSIKRFNTFQIEFTSSPSLNDIAFKKHIVTEEMFNQKCAILAEEVLEYIKKNEIVDFDAITIKFSTSTGFMHPNGPSSRIYTYELPE